VGRDAGDVDVGYCHIDISGEDGDEQEGKAPAGEDLYAFQRDKEADSPGKFSSATEENTG
jgi:hypothetical protein